MSVTTSPTVSSTVGLKNLVIAPVIADTESGTTYGTVQAVAGAIEATVTPQNTDPDVQYADDIEFSVLNKDPEITLKTKMADIPLSIQAMIFGNTQDAKGVLTRKASDQSPYFAVGFKSEKSNGKFRYIWLLKVRAKPVTETYASKEGTTITRQTGEVEWTAIKRTSDGYFQFIGDEDEASFDSATAAAFLTSVYVPTAVDTNLATLTIGSLTLTPTFSASVTTYTASTSNASDVITATAETSGATVAIKNGSTTVSSGSAATWTTGQNVVTITVTKGSNTKTYTVTVTKS